MDRDKLIHALSQLVPTELATDLTEAFLETRRDVASGTLGKSAPGKFVESVVQALQYLSTGKYDKKPAVDDFLRDADNKAAGVDDGLRICAARIARAMYALRSKRNIIHKGEVDPNTYDLDYLLSGAQWIMAELVRQANGIPMQDAGALIEAIRQPVGGLVEDFEGKRLVHGNLTVREEVLLLLHSYEGKRVSVSEIVRQLDRRSPGGVRNELRRMWQQKLVEGDGATGYCLTRAGVEQAVNVIFRESGTDA